MKIDFSPFLFIFVSMMVLSILSFDILSSITKTFITLDFSLFWAIIWSLE